MLSVDQWKEVERVLDAALDSDPSEWGAILDRTCSHDPALRREVEQLLGRYSTARSFLESPPVAPAAALIAEARALESGESLDGRRIGAYRIVRQIGRGGMARVVLAERADGEFEQRVAIKLLRPGLDSEIDQSRFRAERQILAGLNHPNIARLLDGGITSEGAPYLVLEYVEGTPIDTYCDERALSARDRVALFRSVVEATEYAHRSLVVHRDLKPSNIFVTSDGVVKLLDFGLAKLLDAEPGAGRELTTQTSHRWMTPEYAAPEQIRGEPITTATDVYQLGAVLYELLSGALPFGRRSTTVHELEAAVLRDDPPLPSASVAGADAAARRAALRGDLDAIVMKALRKEPERRYASATALLDDLQRFRDGRPVLARAASRGYRARKFVSRHRTGVAAAALLAVAVVAGGVRERTLRSRAEAESRKARAVEDYLVSVFDVADPFAPPSRDTGEVTARAMLDRGAARIDSTLAGQTETQAELRLVLGHVYSNLGLLDKAAPLLARALEQQRSLHGATDTAVARVMDEYGLVLAQQDHFDDAERLLRDALSSRRSALGVRDAATLESMDHLATVLQERGSLAPAESLFREAVRVRRTIPSDTGSDFADAVNNLALVLVRRAKYDEAEPLYRESIAITKRRLGENHPETARIIHNLAQLKQQQGQYAQAETLYRRSLAIKRKTLGSAHPSVTINLNNLGIMLARNMNRPDDAEPLVREALALDRQMFGPKHSFVAVGLGNLGAVLQEKGDFAGAEEAYREALGINRELHGEKDTDVALNLYNLGTLLISEGKLADGISNIRRASEIYVSSLGKEHLYTLTVTGALGRALAEHGDFAQAEQTLRSTLSSLDSTKASNRALIVITRVGLGQTLTDLGRTAEAEPMLEHAVELSRAQFGATHWHTGEAQLALGLCLVKEGKTDRAIPLLRDAYAAVQPRRRASPRLVARAEQALIAAGIRPDAHR